MLASISIPDEDVDAEPFRLETSLETQAASQHSRKSLAGEQPLSVLAKLIHSDSPREWMDVPQWVREWELKWERIRDERKLAGQQCLRLLLHH